MSLGDSVLELWLAGKLASCIERSGLDEADVALVSRMADMEAAVRRGIPVRLVAGALDQTGRELKNAAEHLGVKDVLAWPEGQEGTAAEVLAFLVGAFGDAPGVRIARVPHRVKVISTRQSGGTFLAWNLWHVLRERGVDARLLSVSSASPLASWLTPPYRGIEVGAHQTDGGEVWVLDASDTTAGIEADVVIVVRDCDPAKAFPETLGQDAWFVMNRVPEGVQAPSDVHLVIGDLGALAYEAMTTGAPAAARYPTFAEALWAFWQAVRNGERGFRAEVPGPEALAADKAKATTTESGRATGGFVLDEPADNGSADGGFVLDE
jgi:hypothetical protein